MTAGQTEAEVLPGRGSSRAQAKARSTIRIFALALASACALPAYDFTSLKPEGYVSDFVHVIDTASKVEIERYCRDLEDRTGVQLAFVTLRSLENEPVSDVANLLYRTWGIGQKKSNEGALLLLSIDDRKSRLEVGYGLEPILTDLTTGVVLREMRPALRESHYGDAMIAATRVLGEKILAAKGLPAGVGRAIRTSRPRGADPAVPPQVWIFLAIIVLMFFLNSRRPGQYGHRRGGIFPIFFPPGFPGGGSSRQGGGFGGMSDSGGGFGGFGGGDSGGGGASSDW